MQTHTIRSRHIYSDIDTTDQIQTTQADTIIIRLLFLERYRNSLLVCQTTSECFYPSQYALLHPCDLRHSRSVNKDLASSCQLMSG
jgi:glutathione peroxidase-family protein